jgi:acid-sensing ion channel, other
MALLDEDSVAFKSCDCLPDCNFVDFSFEVRQDKINIDRSKKLLNLTSASVTVTFDDDEFIAYRRYASYGTVTFLSNIGGLLGLFLGISVLSFIETIYFFTLRFIDDLWYKV